MALGLCVLSCNHAPDTVVAGAQKNYDASRPPLVMGQFAHIQHVYCGRSNSGNYRLFVRVLDSTGNPLAQFTVKSLKRPYHILANVGYFTTDQTGFTKVTYQGCDSLELANLSVLNGYACRIATGNLPDTIVLRLTLTQEEFIPTTM
ncbi:hypothetical protein EDB95_2635 [Dinghuibacter silviterrae]|uniref:Uncharacterized protein n=2 Tax=Dinghuibacter silviterrae TaxID=1539049 RepID=A0A4R8DVU5_9BACT|nr:hypothetical protein EDB95_2635 [Dinghuibacter silviterrae]